MNKKYQIFEETKHNGLKLIYETDIPYEVGYALQELQNLYPKRKFVMKLKGINDGQTKIK